MTEQLPLCECGCGLRVTKPGNRFICNHHGCKTPWKPELEPQLCECGCGELAKSGNRFINGHQCRGKFKGEDNPMYGKNHTPEALSGMSKRMTEYFADQSNRDKMSKITTEQWSDQVNRDTMSEIIKNSEAAKIAAENQRGGSDFVWHHVAYDFSRPEALRIRIKRKFHGLIHHPKGISIDKRGYSLID